MVVPRMPARRAPPRAAFLLAALAALLVLLLVRARNRWADASARAIAPAARGAGAGIGSALVAGGGSGGALPESAGDVLVCSHKGHGLDPARYPPGATTLEAIEKLLDQGVRCFDLDVHVPTS